MFKVETGSYAGFHINLAHITRISARDPQRLGIGVWLSDQNSFDLERADASRLFVALGLEESSK